MNEITDLKVLIVNSILIKSCTTNELIERDFLQNRARYGIQILINALLQQSAIYEKDNLLKTNKNRVDKFFKSINYTPSS